VLWPETVTKCFVFRVYVAVFSGLSVLPAFDKKCSTQHIVTSHGLDFLDVYLCKNR
jgi:hypothetical protein